MSGMRIVHSAYYLTNQARVQGGSGGGDGGAIMPASIRLGMILGIMAVSTVVTGVATGAVIGDITTIIRPTMRSPCVIMPMDDPALMAIMQLAEAAA